MPKEPKIEREFRPKRLVQPFDWSLTGPVRGLRSDLQEMVLFPIVRSFARISIEERQHLKRIDGPVVIYANHSSHVDCPVILAALPHRIRQRTIVAAAADYFYKVKALGALTSLALGTIPFERHEGSRESLERCKEGLRRGWSVLIFPEGGRQEGGEIGKFKKGAAFLCVDVRCAALPIFLQGTSDVMPKGSSFPRPAEVIVRFGKPIGPRPDDDYDSMTARLEDALIALGSSGRPPETEGPPR